jgi:hypothetical protein
MIASLILSFVLQGGNPPRIHYGNPPKIERNAFPTPKPPEAPAAPAIPDGPRLPKEPIAVKPTQERTAVDETAVLPLPDQIGSPVNRDGEPILPIEQPPAPPAETIKVASGTCPGHTGSCKCVNLPDGHDCGLSGCACYDLPGGPGVARKAPKVAQADPPIPPKFCTCADGPKCAGCGGVMTVPKATQDFTPGVVIPKAVTETPRQWIKVTTEPGIEAYGRIGPDGYLCDVMERRAMAAPVQYAQPVYQAQPYYAAGAACGPAGCPTGTQGYGAVQFKRGLFGRIR